MESDVKAPQNTISFDSDDDDEESEDWCFVCHDGGKIRQCDFPKCRKAYHYKCVGQEKSFLKSRINWYCARHSCSSCGRKSNFMCYCCPKAVCHQCIDSAEFFSIRQENGFCKDCMSFVLRVEGIMDSGPSMRRMSLRGLSTREKHLKEYYEIIQKQDGVTLDDLESAKKKRKSPEKSKSCGSLDNVEKNKRAWALPKVVDFDSSSKEEEKMQSSKTATSFAAIILENIRLVYLRRTLVEKLLKQPESFENKVKGTFVHVELPSHDGLQGKSHQLVQVTGTRTSSDQDNVDIKLLVSNIPNEISIRMLSNAGVLEEDCEDLRQQVESGLLRRPSVEELEQKARVLHEDMVDDSIALELRMLQPKIDRASEKGWKREKYEYSYRKSQLETPFERERLIKTLPVVIPEVVGANASSQGTADDRQGTQWTNNHNKFNNALTNSGPTNNVGVGGKTISVALESMPTLKDIIGYRKRNEVPATTILDDGWKANEVASVVSLLRGSTGASTPTERHVSKLVKDPVANDGVDLVPQTKDTETNKEPQQLSPEIDDNNSTEGQNMKVKSTAMNAVEPCCVQTPGKQPSICSVPVSPSKGKVKAPEVDGDPAMMMQSNNGSYSRTELDFLTHQNSKSITIMEDELRRLKDKMEDALVYTTKIPSMERRLDLMFEHHLRQSGGAQVEPAKETLTSSTKSKICEDDVKLLLRAGWTQALEMVKAKHLPDLDLSQFPMYDTNARAKADLIAKMILESDIQVDHLVSLEATEEDRHEQNSGQRLTRAEELENTERAELLGVLNHHL